MKCAFGKGGCRCSKDSSAIQIRNNYFWWIKTNIDIIFVTIYLSRITEPIGTQQLGENCGYKLWHGCGGECADGLECSLYVRKCGTCIQKQGKYAEIGWHR